VGAVFRFNDAEDDGFGELNAFQQDGMASVAKGVACHRHLRTDDRHDVARTGFIHIFAVVGMHPKDAHDAFVGVFGGIVNGFAFAQDARIKAHIDEPTDIRVGLDFEG